MLRPVTVHNLRTGEEQTFVGVPPERAVICAYAAERGDNSWWEYETRYMPHVQRGRVSVGLGDWAASISQGVEP
jgi:hypothetical protein